MLPAGDLFEHQQIRSRRSDREMPATADNATCGRCCTSARGAGYRHRAAARARAWRRRRKGKVWWRSRPRSLMCLPFSMNPAGVNFASRKPIASGMRSCEPSAFGQHHAQIDRVSDVSRSQSRTLPTGSRATSSIRPTMTMVSPLRERCPGQFVRASCAPYGPSSGQRTGQAAIASPRLREHVRDKGLRHDAQTHVAIDAAECEVVDLAAEGRDVGALGGIEFHREQITSPYLRCSVSSTEKGV